MLTGPARQTLAGVKPAKHYHYFAHSIQMNESEETKPSKLRDGASFSKITASLGRLGYEPLGCVGLN